jgi:hypothetical protein
MNSDGPHCGPRPALLAWPKDKKGSGDPVGRRSVVRPTRGHRTCSLPGGAASDDYPLLVALLGWQHKMEGVSRRAPGKGKRQWSSPSIGVTTMHWRSGRTTVLRGGGSALVANGDLWGPAAAEARGGFVLWLDGGGGTADHDGGGEVAEAASAATPRRESGVEAALR